MANNSQRLQSALAYAAAGLHVVLLGNAGTKKGKVPRLKEWGKKTTLDEEQIIDQFDRSPSANIGVLLGPKGGVIDVEFDSAEGRATAERIFGDCITPTYESVRSIHRLFRWSGEFPPIQKLEFDGLEIRLGGGDKQTQSVLPPSIHPDGTKYKWLPTLSIHDVELAELPEELACHICNVETGLEAAGLASVGSSKTKEQWEELHSGVESGGRNDALAAVVGRLLQGLSDIDSDQSVTDCFSLIEAWNDRNSPPLPQREVRSTFKSILNRERRSRLEDSMAVEIPKSTEQQVGSAAGMPKQNNGGMRLTIIQGDPANYRLHWGRFSQGEGYIDLNSSQLGSFAAVRTAALEKAFVWLPDEMRKKWSGRNGIVQELVTTAERVNPDDATHRPAILAESIAGLISRAPRTDEDMLRKSGVTSGMGVQIVDDCVVINATKLLGYLKAEQVIDKLTNTEVVKLLRLVGAKEKRSTAARWWILAKPAIAQLRGTFLGGSGVTPENTVNHGD